jgi:hypothetical protein
MYGEYALVRPGMGSPDPMRRPEDEDEQRSMETEMTLDGPVPNYQRRR